MHRLAIVILIVFCSVPLAAQESNWQGEWITDFGIFSIEQSGEKATGKFKRWGTAEGTVSNSDFQFDYQFGQISGTAKLTQSADGLSFSGTRTLRNREIKWRGWRSNPKAAATSKLDLKGTWLTSHGTMFFDQESDRVTGATRGPDQRAIIGRIANGRLTMKLKSSSGDVGAWAEFSESQGRMFGIVSGEKAPEPLIGVRVQDFKRDALPIAGNTVKGITLNGMLYFLRMPEGWQPGNKTDLIVLLHGNGWTTEGMVKILSNKWPDISKRFAIVGIEGDRWLATSSDSQNQFNYVFDQWAGEKSVASKPGLASPDLIIQTIRELDSRHGFERVLLGGHSLGGHMTHLFHMNFVSDVDGLFPVAAKMIAQANPVAYDEAKLAIGRNRPIAIVHGKNDRMVPYDLGRQAYDQYLNYDFARTRFFDSEAGHGFGGLPIGQAIEWLELMTGDEAARGEFAAVQAEKGQWREVSQVVSTKPFENPDLFADSIEQLEKAASLEANRFVELIKNDADSTWVAPFLRWKAEFFAAESAQEPIRLFRQLRTKHDESAAVILKQANKALADNNRPAAVEASKQIVAKFYASHFLAEAKSIIESVAPAK